ncbi:hypothetical protein XU18_0703 [Perkinsela sp. CCAP 1560/4]|nr:hypothetical protein XU18_4509 [Perkinsela sp. CCAP 1560/4]KNH08933.1 hypothetical protein XU18_0703 [Perkinsela sp. CCAP 1560/4]|eukprot:KNH04299.1 hypothetical protein XU18_4509 [Perkinsela sp. CCAP 1560/4]
MDEHTAKRSRVSEGDSSYACPVPEGSPEDSLRAVHLALLSQIEQLDTNKYFHELDESIMDDYRKHVRQPISFAIIRAKLTDGEGYDTHAAFIQDVEMVFGNAIAYFREKDPQLVAALELRQDWENILIEADLMEGDADVYVSTEYDDLFEDEEEEDSDDADLGENLQSVQEKMLEEATMPLTDVIDRMSREANDVQARSAAEIEELGSGEEDDELDSNEDFTGSSDEE